MVFLDMNVFVLQDGDQLRVRGAAGDGHLRNRSLCQEIESWHSSLRNNTSFNIASLVKVMIK